jgi:hypothetical protein
MLQINAKSAVVLMITHRPYQMEGIMEIVKKLDRREILLIFGDTLP